MQARSRYATPQVAKTSSPNLFAPSLATTKMNTATGDGDGDAQATRMTTAAVKVRKLGSSAEHDGRMFAWLRPGCIGVVWGRISRNTGRAVAWGGCWETKKTRRPSDGFRSKGMGSQTRLKMVPRAGCKEHAGHRRWRFLTVPKS